jgi:hypothetical protein
MMPRVVLNPGVGGSKVGVGGPDIEEGGQKEKEEDDEEEMDMDTWDNNDEDDDDTPEEEDSVLCPVCDRLLPRFAVSAHERYHRLGDA